MKGSGLWPPAMPMLLLRSPLCASPTALPGGTTVPLVPEPADSGALADPFTGGDPFRRDGVVVGDVPVAPGCGQRGGAGRVKDERQRYMAAPGGKGGGGEAVEYRLSKRIH